MNRRQFLAACAAVGVAGCSGTGSSGTIDTEATPAPATEAADTASQTQTQTDTQTPTGTPTPAGEAEIVITAQSLERLEREYRTTTFASATVVNDGEVMSGQVHLTARFYDRDDALLSTGDAYLVGLPGGATWQAVVPLLDDGSQVARTEVAGEFNRAPPAMDPDDVTLDESRLDVTEDGSVVTGLATNNRPGTLSYLQANALFHKSEDVVIGSAWTNVSQLPSGESWRFEVSWGGASWHVDTPRSHTVFLTA